METLVLASRSPRRSELLKAAGIPFETADPDVDESFDCPAEEAVSMLSARKAGAVGDLYPGRWILSADTLVVLGGIPLGKPSGPDDAARMLRSLSGRTHQVFTGVSVLSPDRRLLTSSDRSDVSFCRIPHEHSFAYSYPSSPMYVSHPDPLHLGHIEWAFVCDLSCVDSSYLFVNFGITLFFICSRYF